MLTCLECGERFQPAEVLNEQCPKCKSFNVDYMGVVGFDHGENSQETPLIQEFNSLRLHQRCLFEYHCYEGEDSNDAELWHHTHQSVTVLNVIEEADELMYHVRFDDGFEADVFDDELVDSPEKYYRPDYKPLI